VLAQVTPSIVLYTLSLHDALPIYEMKARWPVSGVAIVHRTGVLEIGQASVAIAVSAPHRGEAFEAAQYAIDRLKQIVPIWKKERSEEHTSELQSLAYLVCRLLLEK